MDISESIKVRNASLETIKQIINSQKHAGISDTKILELVMNYINDLEEGE